MRRVHRVLLWRVALGRAVWRAAFVHVGSAYWRIMIRGACAVVKGGFSMNTSSDAGRGGFPPTRE